MRTLCACEHEGYPKAIRRCDLCELVIIYELSKNINFNLKKDEKRCTLSLPISRPHGLVWRVVISIVLLNGGGGRH